MQFRVRNQFEYDLASKVTSIPSLSNKGESSTLKHSENKKKTTISH